MQQEQNTLKMSEVASLLGVNKTYVYSIVKRNKIKLASKGSPGSKGREATITVASVEKLAKKRGVNLQRTEPTPTKASSRSLNSDLEAAIEKEVSRRVDGAVNQRMTAFMSQIKDIQW